MTNFILQGRLSSEPQCCYDQLKFFEVCANGNDRIDATDDHYALVRLGLTILNNDQSDLEVVGESSTAIEAVCAARHTPTWVDTSYYTLTEKSGELLSSLCLSDVWHT